MIPYWAEELEWAEMCEEIHYQEMLNYAKVFGIDTYYFSVKGLDKNKLPTKRSFWEKVFFRKREYLNSSEETVNYLNRLGMVGQIFEKNEHLYLTKKRLDLEFEIKDRFWSSTTHPRHKVNIRICTYALDYVGWNKLEDLTAHADDREIKIQEFWQNRSELFF